MKRPNEQPIPERMQHLPLDHRGYPIFYVAVIDKSGRSMFAINDEKKLREVAEKDLCEVCGTKLFRGRWFIGGPLSAFHPQGAYNDAPMHDECAHYALNVCPWLAAPNYGEAIAELQLKKHGMEGTLTDDPSDPLMKYRPPLFVALMSIGHKLHRHPLLPQYTFVPNRPYPKVEYWVHGRQLPDAEGKKIVETYTAEQTARLEKERGGA